MASRRSRIKGIATIPQRRKNIEEGNETNDSEHNSVIKLEINSELGCIQPTEQSHKMEVVEISGNVQNVSNINKTNTNEEYEQSCNSKQSFHENLNDARKSDQNLLTNTPEELFPQCHDSNTTAESVTRATCTENNINHVKPLIRRKFIKPIVNIVTKKSKILSDNDKEIQQSILPQKKINLVNKLFEKEDENAINIPKNLKSKIDDTCSEMHVTRINLGCGSELTLNEINLVSGTLQSNPKQNFGK